MDTDAVHRTNRPITEWRVVLSLLLGTLGLVAAVPATLVAGAGPALAAPESIELADGAGIIHEPTLRAGLADVDFHEPTTVVVWTQRGEAGSDDLNERVLADVRENHPEWISADGQKWADGLFIYAIDPEARLQGTYFGEDRKVSLEAQEGIREDAVDSLREADWTQAALDASRSAAGVMNRPWYLHPGLWAGSGLVVVLGGVLGFVAAKTRRTRRAAAQKELAEGNRSFANVTTDLEATELNANTVPEDSRYGARVLERYRTFHERYLEAARENDRLTRLPEKVLHKKGHARDITAYRKNAQALDELDDTVASTNTLLNKHPGWPEAWDLQTAPMREDLAEISALTSGQGRLSTAQLTPLRSFKPEAEQRLEQLGAGLQTGKLTPDDALDSLSELRSRLTELLEQFSAAQIDAFAESSKERATVQEQMRRERERVSRRPGSILDTVHQPGWFWTATAYNVGYSSGVSSVTHAREQAASASSGSSTGYGSSGGSFSGAGSSSSF